MDRRVKLGDDNDEGGAVRTSQSGRALAQTARTRRYFTSYGFQSITTSIARFSGLQR
jgi:hypothetical protein